MPDLILDASLLIDDLRTFVRVEFDCQRRKAAERMSMTKKERVEKGSCLDGLDFSCIDEVGRAVFKHGGNDSILRESDLVRLCHDDGCDSFEASIYREEADRIWLVAEKGFKPSQFAEATGWFIDQAYLDLESFFLAALDRLPATEIGQERILPLLMGKTDQALDENEYNAVQEELSKQPTRWEDAQREAIAGCLAADHCYLVQGPPGTGKTRVLAQVVRQLVERGERVLITAFTHRAIDNALTATAREIGDRQRVVRIATPVHRRDENYDLFESYGTSPLPGISGGWVAGATPFALRKRLSGVEFDTIVVDEASQMTIPLAIMAMLTGRKYLFFGDQQQLGPVVVSRSRRDIKFIGIFNALKAQEALGTRLDVTYRLNDVLTSWPSENFYQGELVAAPHTAVRRLQCSALACESSWLRRIVDPDTSLVWLKFSHDCARTVSHDEIALVAEILRALSQGGVKPDDVAVVTPYRRQARGIRTRLDTLMPGQSWRACVIDTVERMQGQEREVIVLSMCASDPFFVQSQAEFIFDPRRLNVSATRARTKLIILASDSLLETSMPDTDFEEDQSLLRSLLQHASVIEASEASKIQAEPHD